MKLATLKDRTRDGMLVVVSRDLTRCVSARPIAQTLQAALDDWEYAAPRLADLAHDLELGAVPALRFHEHEACSPLPRAYQWADASSYTNHMRIMRMSRGEDPNALPGEPLMYQGGSDGFLGPRDAIVAVSEEHGIDLEGEIAVITGDVSMGATPAEAAASIRLVMLANDVSLRLLQPAERAKGFGFFQAKPASAFSPVAVTPDELGTAWDGAKLHLPLLASVNGRAIGRANAGEGVAHDFAALIAHAAKTRGLGAGSIIGGGTISNGSADGGLGATIEDGGAGYACLAEIRLVETIKTGAAVTSFLKFGDTVRIEMKDRTGHSIFGAIEQTVTPVEAAGA
jgi:fumarylacetoacetate (FAA) hydrolase